MISLFKDTKIEAIKIYIFFYILIFPLDLTNFMMSALSIILLIWWLIIGKTEVIL